MTNEQRNIGMRTLREQMSKRIVLLDGGLGTMIQAQHLQEKDFHYEPLTGADAEMTGCNDILPLSRRDVIASIHRAYLEAGADIVETDSFNCNRLSLADYELQEHAYRLSVAAAEVARQEVDRWMNEHPGDRRWVAGSIGPSNRSLSMSPDVNDPAARSVDWDEFCNAYRDQIAGLIDGGVDLLIVETNFDLLNLKAILWTIEQVKAEKQADIATVISVTLTESGRMLSGHTLEAMLACIAHFDAFAVGLNCGFGAEGMQRWAQEFAGLTSLPICIYPNAGLPNSMGCYDETPEKMTADVRPMLEAGLVNILGGCCGTTPNHIEALKALADEYSPHVAKATVPRLTVAGLEPLNVTAETNFVNVGERCNVAGSKKFLDLIKAKAYDEAVHIARTQVESGAQVVDVNMDAPLIDARAEMCHFLRLLASEPDVARVPVMIDSSDWNVIADALKQVPGKSIVNSISLKNGEDEFVEHARYIKQMGAAVVVMAFDENGQADTFDRKTAVCRRAYDILTSPRVNFNPQDIIFDPNILTIATGIKEHERYGLDFILAVEWIKQNLPGVKVSGGVSNLSFAFRGNNYVRQAMHSVFLYHAISRGMDMAIVNAGSILPYDDVPADLRSAIEDVLFCRQADATEVLVNMASTLVGRKVSEQAANAVADADIDAVTRLARMVERGITDGIADVLAQAHEMLGSAIAVIDGPLMSGINRVGQLFGEGKMFLPQVVKSARTMKVAVEWLNPHIEAEQQTSGAHNAGKVVIATVKGDVHDIGKNIVSVVLRCNGYEVIDLGVMVPGEEIVEQAKTFNADIVALSGLITPSLEEMRRVAALMRREGLTMPLMVGGATTSDEHTAVVIAPEYGGIVAHTSDAASAAATMQRILADAPAFMKNLRERQQQLRERYEQGKDLYTLAEARARKTRLQYNPVKPAQMGLGSMSITVAEARRLINWRAFFAAWGLDAAYADIADIHGCDCCRAAWLAAKPQAETAKAAEAMQLFKDANRALDKFEHHHNHSLRAIYGLWEANSDGDDIVIDHRVRLATMRQQQRSFGEHTLSLSDFIAPADSGVQDYIGTFAASAGAELAAAIAEAKAAGDDFKVILYQTLCDRLAEATTEILHSRLRNVVWAYTFDSAELDNPKNLLRHYYKGIRPAVGFPSLPDQKKIFLIDRLMPLSQAEITLTENGAMSPAASTCGLVIAHPDSLYFNLGTIGDDQRSDYTRRSESAEGN
ncbi:MAG: methionine synthase [Muribaculaceae bacterium]